jgi:hypothetical protein
MISFVSLLRIKNMATVPTMFFYEDKLHKYIKIIRSDNSLVAWCYQDEERQRLPLQHVKKYHDKAYTLKQAAALIRCSEKTIKELIKKQMVKVPEKAYDYIHGTYDPLLDYINAKDMLDLRQAVWDQLPKNRFGEPYRDEMASDIELEYRMQAGDDREYIVTDDGDIIKIYKA